jgi:hypothetical protein
VGLDLVELSLAVEDHFGINLTSEWGDIRTVGDLHSVICRKIKSSRTALSNACPSFSVFFVTRNAINAITKADRKKIRPSTQLSSLFTLSGRRQLWNNLLQVTGYRLPPLKVPTAVKTCVVFIVLTTIGFTEMQYRLIHNVDAISLTLLIGVYILLLQHFVSKWFSIAFPANCSTVSDIVRCVLQSQSRQAALATEHLDSEVWLQLSELVSRQLDLPVASVLRESRFVEDLKCG